MNKKIFASLLIATSLTGGLIFNQTVAKADDINGIVTTNDITRLYDNNGKLISNRALAANTPWITNKKVQIDAIGTAYQVATNEFVKDSDVTFQHGQATKGIINVGADGATVYNYSDGNYTPTASKLDGYSSWQYNYTDNNDGKTWYQVSNNSWINSDESSNAVTVKNTGSVKISYAPESGVDLWQGYGNSKVATGQKLINNTEWKFFQKVVDVNGDAWYEIGNNQWVSGAFTKITNNSFNEASAKVWDPNFAVVKATKDTPIYSDSKYSASSHGNVSANTLVEVDSTVQEGNTIWYEISDGGWLPSSAVTAVTTYRAPVALNGKTSSQAIEEVIAVAKQQLGKPYVWNGKGPQNFDCSGLMQYVFGQVTGQNIGAWTVPQETAGTRVSMDQIQRGDLLFWGTPGASYHVALYLGNNEYLNALRPGTNVKIDHISSAFEPSFGVRIF